MLSFTVALVAITPLVMLYRRDRTRLPTGARAVLRPLRGPVRSYHVTEEGSTYPLLRGRYRGHETRLEPVIDNMAWRKVPVLADRSRSQAQPV